MATLQQTAQEILDWAGRHLVVSTFVRSSDATDDIVLPEGLANAAFVTSLRDSASDSALTIDSITQADHPQGVTVTVSAGSAGATYHLMSVHAGNPAGL